MSGMRTLHFTLGPVQGFVAQARRTRDLYSGSFLLSYLAGQAIHKILVDGGSIIFPEVQGPGGEITDSLLLAISQVTHRKKIKRGPLLGTLPNRFKALIPDSFEPQSCEAAVQEAWQRVAGAVWDRYVKVLAENNDMVKSIWDRQINNFWDISWVIGEGDDLLDRRKNWRSFVPTVEPGDKCTLMGNLQEISGHIRVSQRKEQDEFWNLFRNQISEQESNTFELREDERLCAISLVKRLYPRVSERAIGWPVPVYYPSTSYMAAVHWVAGAIENSPEQARDFVGLAAKLGSGVRTEDGKRFKCIEEAIGKSPQAAGLACLDGKCFFDNFLQNDRLWPGESTNLRRLMIEKLKIINEKPSLFYAVLLMDGDRLGALLGEYDGKTVSRALARFSKKVEKIVEGHNGVTIYAGGDDVMALIPLEDALPAAIDLRISYTGSFEEEFENQTFESAKATLSGSIVYAQNHVPLKSVLMKAHHLLDDVAKNETGRDSVAITVWKGAGPVITWSAPWAVVNDETPNLIDELVSLFKGENSDDKQYNSSFFYNICSRFAILGEKSGKLADDFGCDLLTAEYLKNRVRKVTADEARHRMSRLLKLCRRSWRDSEGIVHDSKGQLSVDGALLVRFLAGKGVSE